MDNPDQPQFENMEIPPAVPPSHHPNNKLQKNPFPKTQNRNFRGKKSFPRKPQGANRFSAYEHKPLEKGLLSVPRETAFEVYTSNKGIEPLCTVTHSVITGKDFRLGNLITLLQLQYVTNIVFLNRCVQVSIKYGKSFPTRSSVLKQVASSIPLPGVLCDYIECLGAFKLPTGTTVIPYMKDWDTMFGLLPAIDPMPPIQGINGNLYLDPRRTLQLANRPIPPDDWAIDFDWIQNYISATSRASRSGIGFRTVNPDFEGKLPLLAGFNDEFDSLQHASGPLEGLEPELQLGACYRFRDDRARDDWLIDPDYNYNYLVYGAFETNVFRPETFFTSRVHTAFTAVTRV